MYIFSKGGAFASGTAGKDAILTYFGNGYASYKFSIYAGKKPDDEAVWVECNAKFETGEYAASIGIYKGDRVTVWGNIESRESNGKTYTTLIVDDLIVRHKGVPVQKPAQQAEPQNDFLVDENFEEPDDLPF